MAKITKLGNSKPTGNKYPIMPETMQSKLNGLSINDALAAGIVENLGDKKGGFIFEAKDENFDAYYAIVEDKRVQLTQQLVDELNDIPTQGEKEDYLGRCQFMRGISTIEGEGYGKAWFRLTRPAGVELKATAAHSISVEPVEV